MYIVHYIANFTCMYTFCCCKCYDLLNLDNICRYLYLICDIHISDTLKYYHITAEQYQSCMEIKPAELIHKKCFIIKLHLGTNNMTNKISLLVNKKTRIT